MAVELFWGGKPSVGSELRFLELLKGDLEDSGTSAIVLANFFTDRPQRQIDFLVITGVHVCHVELKAYAGELVGGTNGIWSVRRHDGTREPIDRGNPYQQARDCKYALSDAMHSFATREGHPPIGRKFYTQFDSVVCIFPRLEEGSEVPDDDRVRTLGYTDLVNFLRNPGNRLPWSRDRWLDFIRVLGLVKGGAEGERAVDTSIAARKVETYCRAFTEFYAANLHDLVPLPLTVDQTAIAPIDFRGLLQEVDRVQLVGPSGAGKSHLARHAALALAAQGAVPVLVAAGMYEKRLMPLLNRVISRFFPGSANDLLQAAKILGRGVILIVDGFNECPLALREQLLGDLSALRLYAAASILITTQEETAHGGILVHTGELAMTDKTALLKSYGSPELLPLCEAFSTAYELSIASECAAELSEGTTRGTLMDAFIRKRLEGTTFPSDVRGVLRRLAVAMNERLATWLPVDVVRRIAEQSVLDREAPSRVIDDALGSSLTVIFQGRFSFSHELVGRFFVAENLMLVHRSPTDLAEQLERPRNQDLPPLIVPLEPDGDRLRSLVRSLGDAGLFVEAMKGSQGPLAARVVRSMALDVIRKAIEGLSSTTFAVGPDYRLHVSGGYRLSRPDTALLAAAGAFTFHGDFLDDVVALLDATDAACCRSNEAAERAPSASYVVATVFIGLGRADESVAAQAFVDHYGNLHQYRQLKLPEQEGTEVRRRLVPFVAETKGCSHGRLLLLSSLLGNVPSAEVADLALDVLRLAWHDSAYHVQLSALMMIQNFATTAKGNALHGRIVEALEQLDAADVHPLIGSQLLETMDSFGMVTSALEAEQVRAEIVDLQREEMTGDTCRRAYGVVTSQFEDLVGEAYFTAIEELSAEAQIGLFTMAAIGAPDGFWTDTILRKLVDLADRRTLPAFLRWTTQFDTSSGYIQGVAACYVVSLEGCALFLDGPPMLDQCENENEDAWQCLGAIVFWLFRAEHRDVDVATRCAPYWQRLQGELAPAAADALYWFADPAVAIATECKPAFGRLLEAFPEQLRATFEWSLRCRGELTSLFGERMLLHGPERLVEHVVSVLGYVGNADTVELLRDFVDDPTLGPTAIKSIRSLNGDST
ncbi:NERD domain-containing protein [Amycolatopsis thailandensis]|uniref:NERD domain-containing protein n=1 Tax=Amycolatopsis thailandensis TaxID=589330 RepID=UPI0037B2C240